MIRIDLQNVGKRYMLHRKREFLAQRVKTQMNSHPEEFWAVRDISLKVESGASVALIGPNGAGKSTLLSIIVGVTQPTTGAVSRRGRIAALLELGAGFHPDLTGRENVMLNGILLGLTKRQVRAKFDSIVAFSELETFIDEPLRTYSSGMVSRLGFATAVHTDPEILVVDEALAVGDAGFQRKCKKRVAEFLASGTTLLLVSHSTKDVLTMCRRAVWLEHGHVEKDDSADEVVEAYLDRYPDVDKTAELRGAPVMAPTRAAS